jgi:DNA-directed RNA polymerase subunit L
MENINKTDTPLRKYLLDQKQVTTYAIKHTKNTECLVDSTIRTELEGDTCGNARTALQETLNSMVDQKMDRSSNDLANVK